MINDLAFIVVGGALLAFSIRTKEDSPMWLMSIWGMVLVLRGIGFLHYAVPTWSFLPFIMIMAMIFFKAPPSSTPTTSLFV